MVSERTVPADSRIPPMGVRAGVHALPSTVRAGRRPSPTVAGAGSRVRPTAVRAARRSPMDRRAAAPPLRQAPDMPDLPSRNGSCVTGSWGRNRVDPREETS